MTDRLRTSVLLFVTLALVVGSASAKVVVAPLQPAEPPVGILFTPTDHAIKVTATDARTDKDFLAAALIGPAAEEGKGILLGYATPRVDDLARFFERAANDAVKVLGMKTGDEYRLELTIREFVVDMYRLSAYTPMNCMGYGKIDARLTSAGGDLLQEKQVQVAYYEHRTPKVSMKEVSKQALSRIYMQAAWQATAETLLDHFELTPDMNGVQSVLDALDDYDTEVEGRHEIFWLGIAHLESPAVTDKLLAIFRTGEDQKVHQAAAEALGMLHIAESRDEMAALLAGAKEFGEWDIEDNEHVWYLLHSLALLGQTDLAAHVPAGDLRMRSKIDDLIRFHETGRVPEIKADSGEMQKARKALTKKRAKA